MWDKNIHHNDLMYRHLGLMPQFEENIIERKGILEKTIKFVLKPVFFDFSDLISLDEKYINNFDLYLSDCLANL